MKMKLIILTIILVLQLIIAALVSMSGNTAQTLVNLFTCFVTYDGIRYIRDRD